MTLIITYTTHTREIAMIILVDNATRYSNHTRIGSELRSRSCDQGFKPLCFVERQHSGAVQPVRLSVRPSVTLTLYGIDFGLHEDILTVIFERSRANGKTGTK